MGKSRKRNSYASGRKRPWADVKRPWADVNPDVLYSVMMRVGVVDFVAFSGVCKSWRSLALCNRKTFMASKPPLAMRATEKTCYLVDFERRGFNTIIPELVGRKCVGLTCGYLILFGDETRDFFLVNPITRHQLHFPHVPLNVGPPKDIGYMRGILVFSPSINALVFVVLHRYKHELWFSIAGKGGAWNHVSCKFPLVDLHPFKGKIYILSMDERNFGRHVFEMRLDPVPKLTLYSTQFLKSVFLSVDLISSDENLYLMDFRPEDCYKLHKLNFDNLNWVPCEHTMEEYTLFYGNLNHGAVVKPESWAGPSSQYGTFFGTHKTGQGRCLDQNLWFFPHDCLNTTLIDQ